MPSSVRAILKDASSYLQDLTSRMVLQQITSDFEARQESSDDKLYPSESYQSPSQRLNFTDMTQNISKTLNESCFEKMLRPSSATKNADDDDMTSPSPVKRISSPLLRKSIVSTTNRSPSYSPKAPSPSPEKRQTCDIDELCDGASRMVLSSIKTPSKQKKNFGTETVAVPVRRSVRINSSTNDEQVLESTGYAYTPNKALEGSNFKKGFRNDTPLKKLEMTPKMLGDCLMTVSEALKENTSPEPQSVRRSSRRLSKTPNAIRKHINGV